MIIELSNACADLVEWVYSMTALISSPKVVPIEYKNIITYNMNWYSQRKK